MVYDFAAKIINVKNEAVFNAESLESVINDIHKQFDKPLELKCMLSDCGEPANGFLVRSQISVSTMPGYHDNELEQAVALFKGYVEALERAVNGNISKKEGFYNNTKTFRRLYDD